MKLAGKVVLVSGGTGGLGGAVVEQFVEAGAEVLVAARGAYRGPAAASVYSLEADLTDEESVNAMMSAACEHAKRLDVLVNVVGGFEMGEPVATTATATWRKMLQLNLDSAFYLSRAALRPMLAQRSGRILHIGSRAALFPMPRAAAYATSKAALVALVENMAEEVRQNGITVNAVLPSIIDTTANRAAMPAANFDTWVTPEQLARILIFLAGPDASVITGAAIPAYGRAV